jgi:hypothetical protein
MAAVVQKTHLSESILVYKIYFVSSNNIKWIILITSPSLRIHTSWAYLLNKLCGVKITTFGALGGRDNYSHCRDNPKKYCTSRSSLRQNRGSSV